MARRSIQGARAIVTGASSGIGRALALELARHGARIVITARRVDRLTALADEIQSLGAVAHVVPGDITDTAVRAELLNGVRARLGGLDLLVNNAGVGAVGPFVSASDERLRRIMEVNFFAPVEMIRAAIPLLREGHRPLIVNIGSVLGHRAVPKKSEYCASKFAMHGFSDALRAELKSFGIDVLLVSPSTTASEFFDNVLESEADLPWLSMGAMPAPVVARKAVRAMRRGQQEIILTPGGKLLVWFDRLCPPVANRMVARFG